MQLPGWPEWQSSPSSNDMGTIGELFLETLPLIESLSSRLNKPVNLEFSGEDIELDRSVLLRLIPHVQMAVRQAIEHGIESDLFTRIELGKPAHGRLHLTASASEDAITLQIKDDGAGDSAGNFTGMSASSRTSEASPAAEMLSFEVETRINVGATVTIRIPITNQNVPGRKNDFALPMSVLNQVVDGTPPPTFSVHIPDKAEGAGKVRTPRKFLLSLEAFDKLTGQDSTVTVPSSSAKQVYLK